jgi:hypothetical protein
MLENHHLFGQLQDAQHELVRFEHEMKDFIALTRGTSEAIGVDPVVANTQRLSQRVDELEDLVVELKQKQSASDIVEIRQVVSQLHLENAALLEKIKVLSEARGNSKDLFGANDMH